MNSEVSDIEGGLMLTAKEPSPAYSVSLTGLTAVIETTYQLYKDVDTGLCQYVSESMFAWYCVTRVAPSRISA